MSTKPCLLLLVNIGGAALLCAILTLLCSTGDTNVNANSNAATTQSEISNDKSAKPQSGNNAPKNQSGPQDVQCKSNKPDLNKVVSVADDPSTVFAGSSLQEYEYEPAADLGLGIHTMSGYVYSRDGKPLHELTIVIKYVWEYDIERGSVSHFSLRPRYSSSFSHEEFPLAEGIRLVTTWFSVAAPINETGYFEIHNLPMVKMKIYIQNDRYSDHLLLKEGIYPGHHMFYAEDVPTK